MRDAVRARIRERGDNANAAATTLFALADELDDARDVLLQPRPDQDDYAPLFHFGDVLDSIFDQDSASVPAPDSAPAAGDKDGVPNFQEPA
jgi:hypothetical protein